MRWKTKRELRLPTEHDPVSVAQQGVLRRPAGDLHVLGGEQKIIVIHAGDVGVPLRDVAKKRNVSRDVRRRATDRGLVAAEHQIASSAIDQKQEPFGNGAE